MTSVPFPEDVVDAKKVSIMELDVGAHLKQNFLAVRCIIDELVAGRGLFCDLVVACLLKLLLRGFYEIKFLINFNFAVIRRMDGRGWVERSLDMTMTVVTSGGVSTALAWTARSSVRWVKRRGGAAREIAWHRNATVVMIVDMTMVIIAIVNMLVAPT